MSRVVLNIRNIDTIPLLPLMLKGLSFKFKNILLYVEDIPISIKQYLKSKLNIKIKLADSCSDYNYILEIKGIKKSGYKVVYKNKKLLLFLNKAIFVPDDLRIQKLRQTRILTDIPVENNNCRKLKNEDWIIPLMQSNSKIGQLIKAFLRDPLPVFFNKLRTEKDLDMYGLIVQRLKSGNKILLFSNIDDFVLALVIVAILNFVYLQHYKIKFNNEFICEPVFEDNKLLCRNTSLFKYEDLTGAGTGGTISLHNSAANEKFQGVNNAPNSNVESQSNQQLSVQGSQQAKQQLNNLDAYQNNDNSIVQGDTPTSAEDTPGKNKNNQSDINDVSVSNQVAHENNNDSNEVDSKDGVQGDIVNTSKGKNSEDSKITHNKNTDPMEIDVEQWALKIQEMLGS